MEATIAGPVPPSQSTPLPRQTTPNTNAPQPLPRNITAQEKRAPEPAPRTPTDAKSWQKTQITSPLQNTLPAVQSFLQRAYETVQRSQQGGMDSVPGAAAAHIPSPRIATAMIQHPLQNTFSIPLPPQTPIAAPFQYTTVTAQPSATTYNIKAVEESLMKTKAFLALDKSPPVQMGQSKKPKAFRGNQTGQPSSPPHAGQVSSPTGASPKTGQTFYNTSFQVKQKLRTAPDSPQKRSLLVAKRRQSPIGVSKTVESETGRTSQSGQSSSVFEKSSTKTQPQSPKSQKPSESKSQRTQSHIPKSQKSSASESSSTKSPQNSSSSSSESSARSPQSRKDPPKDPSYQSTSRVAQTYQTFVAQKERGQALPAAQFLKALVKRNMQSNADSPTRANGDRRDPPKEEPDLDPNKTVLVSGFAPYTQPQDLIRVLSAYGNCQVVKCRNRLAVVIFETEMSARCAIKASDEICIYGEFVEITEYTNSKHVNEMFKSFKKVISTQKGDDIVEPNNIDLSGDFYQQMDNIKNAILLTREQAEAVSNLYRDLERVLQVEWPGCVAVPFGSIPAGLGIKSSDADCFVELPAQFRTRNVASCFVNRARRLLLAYPLIFAQLVAIPRANTPILKFRHLPSGFHCDVSSKTPLGAQNSKLIKFLLEHDVRLPPVAVLVKYWAKVHELSGTGRLTNYALTMMVVFFFQQPRVGLVPAVERLQRDPAAAFTVDRWNAGFSTRRRPPAQPCPLPVPDLLGEFFDFYARFDFDDLVICPFLGAALPKSRFQALDRLPREMTRYAANVYDNLASPIRHNTPFCVQDPFEQSHNVASAVTQKLAHEIRLFLRHAADAYAADKATGCRGFLRTILTTRPKVPRDRAAPSTKIYLVPRVRGDIADADWRARVRRTLLDVIFERMLRLPLRPAPPPPPPGDESDEVARARRFLEAERRLAAERKRAARTKDEPGRDDGAKPLAKMDTEKYSGAATKAVWRRRKNYSSVAPEPERTLVARQRLATDQIVAAAPAIELNFELELGFRDEPRTCCVFVKMVDGDMDAFRGLVAFVHTTMFDWFRILLRPHLKPFVDPRSAPGPAPEVAEPSPKVAEPSPKVAEPSPKVTEPSPKVAEPSPILAEPSPKVAEPAPKVAEPSPKEAEPSPKVAEPSPKEAETSPKVVEPAPELTKSALEIADLAPEVAEPTPEVTKPAAKIAELDLEVAETVSEVAELAPEATKPALEIAEPTPEVAEPAPEVAEPAPEVAEPAPEVAEPAPEVTKPTPEISELAPEVAEPAPKVRKPALEIAEPTPEVAEPASEVAELVPEVAEPAPKVAEPAPEVAEHTPEVAEHTPEVAEPAPEVTKPTPGIAELAPEVAEPAPSGTERITEALNAATLTDPVGKDSESASNKGPAATS